MEDEVEEQSAQVLDPTKFKILPGASEDGSAASFQLMNEDHTLGYSLQYVIMKNPEVEFCGYSIPHPSEPKMNIRIQTYGKISAIDALESGLDNLIDLCDVVEEKFIEQVNSGNYKSEEP
ncbi:RNA polymerase I and III subunit [Nadsonia fulvescens var. elongata DSM 6958]|uniref:DNA-directed RNA polymerases I and III subunit RPAC2 n=1 Tax=Nadsonia fulvescens var. elongata DSM 6958 TaxID=857566 RepID=A0A1E3PQ28_9ASCO|nr:RNA polymerase I and III subunit [Nadsonia fulvescens var. elongata DSM 6958]